MTLSIIPVARPDLLTILEDRGYRLTRPRRTVISLLDQKQEGFSAEEVCGDLPHVGRATVYRTIKLLLNAGVICKLALPDGAPKSMLLTRERHSYWTSAVYSWGPGVDRR